MSLIRALLVWMIMAALPLQGLAAASMLYCGMTAHHGAESTAAHDHSRHDHGTAVSSNKATDEAKQTLPDADHKCGVCASCCHSLAITEFPQTVVFAPLPQVQSAEPFVLIHARPALAPDRPPRA